MSLLACRKNLCILLVLEDFFQKTSFHLGVSSLVFLTLYAKKTHFAELNRSHISVLSARICFCFSKKSQFSFIWVSGWGKTTFELDSNRPPLPERPKIFLHRMLHFSSLKFIPLACLALRLS